MKNENVSIEAIMKKHEYEDKIEDLEEAIAEATAEKHSAIIIFLVIMVNYLWLRCGN